MFGKGVYFADMMSKVSFSSTIFRNSRRLNTNCSPQTTVTHSKQTPYTILLFLAYDLEFSLSNGTGLLLLCEVAAKPFHELTNGVSVFVLPSLKCD